MPKQLKVNVRYDEYISQSFLKIITRGFASYSDLKSLKQKASDVAQDVMSMFKTSKGYLVSGEWQKIISKYSYYIVSYLEQKRESSRSSSSIMTQQQVLYFLESVFKTVTTKGDKKVG